MVNWEEKIKELISQAKSIQVGYAKEWLAKLKRYERVCIFGAGQHGITWFSILKKYGVRVDYFCDNDSNRWGKEVIEGIMCFPPGECAIDANIAVIIAIRDYKGVYNQILKWKEESSIFIGTVNSIGFTINYDYIGSHDKLDNIYMKMSEILKLCDDEMSKEICYLTVRKWLIDEKSDITYNGESYFFTEEVKLSEDEYLVDAGAFDGDTIRSFEEAVSDRYGKIYAFEMDKRNYENLKKQCFEQIIRGSDTKIELYQIGLSDKKEIMHYSSNFETSQFSMGGDEVCETDSLDNILHNKKVTFIKMDIEGSEMKALHGAQELIKSQKPKLAICIYHSIDDFLSIPSYIKKLNPEYRIIIRHHSMDESETVCYAF